MSEPHFPNQWATAAVAHVCLALANVVLMPSTRAALALNRTALRGARARREAVIVVNRRGCQLGPVARETA